jgi:hypothetical protein
LNSSVFDVLKRRFVAKPVLSFLRPSQSCPGTILPDVLRGISSFRWSVQQIVVKGWMRYEICLRGVSAGLSEISPRWMSELLKLRWFRAACLTGEPPVQETGVDRALRVTVGPPPRPRFLSFVTKVAAELSSERTRRWLGVRVKPVVRRIDRYAFRAQERFRSPRLSSLFTRGEWRWTFSWPAELLVFVREKFPAVLRTTVTSKWADDHPFLARRRVFYETPRAPSWRNPAFASSYCADYPLGHR